VTDFDRVLRKARAAQAIPSPHVCRAIREAAGLTLRDVGAALGVSYTTVFYWERGRNRPGPAVREKYAELLSELRRGAAA
jgi:DNA-binding transcriptional regulator YiaG